MNRIINEDLLNISQADIDWSLFNGKSILITGANGLLPSYIAFTLIYLQLNNQIKIKCLYLLVRNIEKAKVKYFDFLHLDIIQFIGQDVCNEIYIKDDVHFIVHAASQASPKYYGADPTGTIASNTIGTFNLLEFAKNKTIESFLYFSSSEVYGQLDNDGTPITESDYGYIDPLNVRSCYSESKRMGENICISYFHQFCVPIKIVRPFHTYGPGMYFDDGRVFSDFVADIVNHQNIKLNSDGLSLRSFCYLSDATKAFFLILLKGKNGVAYNMGNPDCEISINDLAHLLINLFPDRELRVETKEIKEEGYIKSVIRRSTPNVDLLKKLGWKPIVSLVDGFKRTINSYET